MGDQVKLRQTRTSQHNYELGRAIETPCLLAAELWSYLCCIAILDRTLGFRGDSVESDKPVQSGLAR
jgi:hypothetical protein